MKSADSNQMLFQKSYIFALLFAISCIHFVGCGGGTIGTGGGGTTRIFGTIATPQGIPLSHVSITLIETGDGSETNDLGEFEFETELNSETGTLVLEKGNQQTELAIDELSPSVSEVSLLIEYDLGQNKARVVDSNVVTNTPTIAPTAEIIPTSIAMPTATVEVPQGIPQPTPVPTSVPSEPTPTQIPTIVVPSGILLVLGDVEASDPRVLRRAAIKLEGGASGEGAVDDDGSFRLMATLVGGETQLQFISHLDPQTVSLGIIEANTQRIQLHLHVEVTQAQNGQAQADVTLESIEIH